MTFRPCLLALLLVCGVLGQASAAPVRGLLPFTAVVEVEPVRSEPGGSLLGARTLFSSGLALGRGSDPLLPLPDGDFTGVLEVRGSASIAPLDFIDRESGPPAFAFSSEIGRFSATVLTASFVEASFRLDGAGFFSPGAGLPGVGPSPAAFMISVGLEEGCSGERCGGILLGALAAPDFGAGPVDVPAPAGLAVFGLGLLGLGLARRR
jgi:hypothetical protein